jgi:hypothetical protein
VLTVFAVLRLGGVVVQHDPASTASELHAEFARCGARVVVCLDRVHDTVAGVQDGTAVQTVVVTSLADYAPSRTRLRTRLPLPAARRQRERLSAPLHPDASTVPFLRLVGTPTAARQTPVDPPTPALLQHTGGTTGPPRAAVLTHGNLVSNAYMNRLWDTGGTAGGEVTLGVLPLWSRLRHDGVPARHRPAGGTLVLLPSLDVDELLAAVDRWRPTMLPRCRRSSARSPTAAGRLHDLSSLRVCVSGAVRLPPRCSSSSSGCPAPCSWRATASRRRRRRPTATRCRSAVDHGTIGAAATWDPLQGRSLPTTGRARCRSVHAVSCSSAGRSLRRLVGSSEVLSATAAGCPPATSSSWTPTASSPSSTHEGHRHLGRVQSPAVRGRAGPGPPSRRGGLRGRRSAGTATSASASRRTSSAGPPPSSPRTRWIAHCAQALAAYKVPRSVELREALPRTLVGTVRRRELVDEELAVHAPDDVVRKSSRPDGR